MIRGCIACQSCKKTGKCVFDDAVNIVAAKIADCDGILIGSPVHFAGPSATLVAFLDRLFYSCKTDKRMKVGAAIVVARRGGCASAFDQLNKYLTYSGMAVATSQYWNSVHGALPGEVESDAEGLQTVRTLANNMVFLMRSIALGKEKYGLPEREKPARTNFIR
jgi:multimeric flavodoxin WrbA